MVFAPLTDAFRLTRAAWALSRHDALIPKEFAPLLPAPLRALGALSRIGARRRGLRPGERMAAAFEKLGPSYVKLGQLMATRPDIIGFEMAADLARLQDRMPPFSMEAARASVEKAFGGAPIEAVFPEFSEPVAAASVAQVHKARLTDGSAVAVKVLRPGIERDVAREYRAFGRIARIVAGWSKTIDRLEPVKFIETLTKTAAIELDLRMEAGAGSELGEALSTETRARVPAIIWPRCARRVLTLEWIDGDPITDLAALDRRGVDRKALATLIIRIFLKTALHDGFFHADMHQGNLLIDRAGRLVLIDFGIMGRLDAKSRRTFAEIIYGFITRDYKRTADVHFRAGYVPAHYSRDAFAQALRSVGEPLQGRNAAQVDMSRVLQQLFDVTDMFDMHLRPELVLLQRTMVTVEGVARALDPEIDMWVAATPIVKDYVESELGLGAQVAKLREATEKAIEIAPDLPRYIEYVGQAARAMSDDEIGLGEPTRRAFLEAARREGRRTRRALFFMLLIAGAGAAAALYFA